MINNLHQNKGFALVMTLIFMSLVVSFITVFILAVSNSISQANRVANEKKAYYVADAGLADAYERLSQAGHSFIPPPAGTLFVPSANTDNGVYAVGTGTGNYSVTIAVSSAPETNYTITSTGTFASATKTLQLKLSWASFSKYAYWSQTEINPTFGQLWWVGMPGMEMLTNGPVQTNGQLNIFGNPLFYSPVTEANLPLLSDGTLGSAPTSTTPNYYYGTAATPDGLGSDPNYIFMQGITNDAPPIGIVPQNTLNVLNSVASDGEGLVLTGNSTVIFNPTGTITVTGQVLNPSNCTATTTYNNTTISPPHNGVVYVQSTSTIPACHSLAQDGNVTVQGTVSGQLTVAADQNMYLSGSVSYNDPPVRAGIPGGDPNSTDLVGLVANQNITVIEASAPTQLEISAVMMAVQGSFQVDQFWVYRGDATTAVMDQFGSLINYVCGATGEIDMSGNLLGGWNQIQSYDTRLAKMSPPGFAPMLNSSGDAVYTKLSISEL